jgi:hypothetical protein
MPRYYFQQHLNGQRLAEDKRGRQFDSVAEARTFALRRVPDRLGKALRFVAKDTYLSTEVSNGARTLYIIRGKVTSERW